MRRAVTAGATGSAIRILGLVFALAVVLALVLAPGLAGSVARAGGAPAAAPETGERATVDRVLVVSLPDVDWQGVVDAAADDEIPNLEQLLAGSSVGGMVTNGVLRPSNTASSYVSLGAGTRAVAPGMTGGQGLGVDEPFGRDPAGVVFTARTGTPAGPGIVYLPIADTIDLNDAKLYGAEVGLLGDELARAGIDRAVIANGDGSDPGTPELRFPPYRRSAVAALMTNAGRLPDGQVDRGLLRADARAPFGVRLDGPAVHDAFTAVWRDRAVVLVEGSDLVRAELAGNFASEEQAALMVRRALRATDRIVGMLLEEVDARRDAVLVIGPEPPDGEHGLTVASVRAPGFEPGLLRSSSTGRTGFVSITDVAPTILRLVGIERPDAMEGRTMETGAAGGAFAARARSLVDDNTDGLFRDGQVGAAMTVVVVLVCVLALATIVVVMRWRRRAGMLVVGGLFVLALLDATYLAAPFAFGRHGGVGAYWAFVAVTAMLLTALFVALGRWLGHELDGLLVALGSIVGLHVVDLVTGAHLEWNAVFGYSPTIGIRFVGQGNLAFAQLVAAAVLFAALVAWRVGAPGGARIAVGVLAVTGVVMVAPAWGNDFGAALSAVPAFGLLGWMLLGRRVTARTVAGLAAIVAGVVGAITLIDVLRPAEDRTHVGKFFVKLVQDTDAGTLVIRRKAAENLSVIGHSVLIVTIFVVAGLVAILWYLRPRALRDVVSRIPTVPAAMAAFLVAAVLGTVLNDSGVTIPGMMAAVLEGAMVVAVATVVAARRQ